MFHMDDELNGQSQRSRQGGAAARRRGGARRRRKREGDIAYARGRGVLPLTDKLCAGRVAPNVLRRNFCGELLRVTWSGGARLSWSARAKEVLTGWKWKCKNPFNRDGGGV